MRALLRVGCGWSARGRHLCTSSGAALAHARLREQLASVKQQLRSLETAHLELRESRDGLEDELKTLVAANPDLRSERHASDAFAPPKLHHINVVSREVTGLLEFYRDVLRMDEMPIEMFPRTGMTAAGAGSDVPISFTTDGHMQMHLATRDLGVAFRSGEAINPIGVGPIGHIAFRTDDIDAFKRHLDAHGVQYADYGTRFARDWHQIFFLDPEGVIIEVHAVLR